ncbi:OLC1v1021982C1 [Oldenlandia corymbosa var. corymbosa]|uniref:Pectinesterase n=1 Tax=Oldenlandia corymbosa var. corymbosa TaxID=529605 RepID=A0AAV1BZ93_OLDCO|nr:OLC1v1021982C1 [Oldenlandia corymbosa var. corymbosa]
MANTTNQPLLGTPRKRSTPFKFLYVILTLATILVAISLISATTINKRRNRNAVSSKTHLCDQAYDQSSCLAMLSEISKFPSTRLFQSSNLAVLQMVLAKSSSQIGETMEFTSHVRSRMNDKTGDSGLTDCLELMDLSMDRIKDSMAALGRRNSYYFSNSDVHSWLASVLTNHVTCLDGLNRATRLVMEPRMNELRSTARTSLALFVAISQPKEHIMVQRFPSWISSKERKLLQGSGQDINADLVVAKDGSGNYTTVQAAVDAAPKNSQTRYVIYVKQGTYSEQVNIAKNQKNLMLVGDGMNSTIITGSLNVVDGSTTFRSATVAAVGDGFIAQDLCFQNTAGPEKHQAVALRVGADKSVINRCKIDAFQDTLYAHSLRQFYRDCYVTGTVDFIFGDAAVVLQNCQLVARLPMSNQQNMVTAQGRTDPNSNTGTSIQNCNITASSDLEPVIGSIKTFLGRPWKEYSRTVVMESSIGDVIDPAGWAPWNGDLGLSTLYYGEYMNTGPGAGTSQRVNWTGYHIITSPEEASQFTVAQFIQGNQWLQNTGVTYNEGL